MIFSHQTVLLQESINGLQIKPDGIYVDCTLGGGGHSAAILERLSQHGLLVSFDQDEDAIKAATPKLAALGRRNIVIHANFADFKTELHNRGINAVDGILMDIGVSSYQLDNETRGFSYQHDAELDMRMDKRQKYTAKDAVNNLPPAELAAIIAKYGEEKWAKRITEFIVAARSRQEIKTTFQLVEIIKNAIPAGARKSGPHPAKRTFQALRIFINKELEVLQKALSDAVEILKPQGRICVITFHSLEDRIVKEFFKKEAQPCLCPPQLPCVCGKIAKLNIVNTKPIVPSENEIKYNPRARSAKLRIAEKI